MTSHQLNKSQLLREVEELRRRIKDMEKLESEYERTASSLRDARDFLQSVIDAIPQVTMVVDRDCRVVLANRAAREMAGGENPVSGHLRCYQVSHHRDVPCSAPADLCPLARAVEARKPVVLTHVHQDAVGNESIVEVSATPILDDRGEVARVIYCCCDVSERKKAEAALRQERDFANSLIETAHSIVLVLDCEGRVVRYNPYMENLSGYLLEEVQGKDWFATFLPQREQPCVRELFCGALEERHARGSVNAIVTKNGVEREIAWWAKSLKNIEGRVVGVLFIGHDVTDLKGAQQRLVQAERLAAIGEAMAGLAHESRNALQRSQACLEMLASRVADQPEALDLIDRIQEAQDHLHHLYEEVREYAAPVLLKPKTHDLRRLLEKAWDATTAARQPRGIQLAEAGAGLDSRCEVDGFAVQQVFRNVLENALDACSDPVEIEVRYAETEIGGRPALQIAICDNGPGLTAEQRRRLFDAFYTTKTKGTGLGMAIAKRLIEAHGGRIHAGADCASGAEIVIVLPRKVR